MDTSPPTFRPAARAVTPRTHRPAQTCARCARVLPVASLLVAAVAPSAHGAVTAQGAWRTLPPAPIELGDAQTGAWTGHEALFAVPTTGSRQAAAYNPTTNTWRRLPGGPAPATPVEGGDRSVWTGKEWILVGWGPNSAYRPATNTWRRLPSAPIVSPAPVVVWTGAELIAWGGGCCGDFNATGTAYRPSTNRWRRLPTSPLAGRQQAAAVWTGTEMVIVGGFADRTFPDGVTRSVTFRDGAAYNPRTNTWRKLPQMPAGRRAAAVVWTGRDVLVVGGWKPVVSDTATVAPAAVGLFAYRPATNRWRLLQPLPRGRFGAATVWTGSRLIVAGGTVVRRSKEVATTSVLSFDPRRNAWSALATMPGPRRNDAAAVWTGRTLIVAGPARDAIAFTR